MFCKDCQTNITDDDITICPVCGVSLVSKNNPMEPADHDPSEDADVDPRDYMRFNPDTMKVEPKVDAGGRPASPKKHRRKVKHRVGWIDPRKRKKVADGKAKV